VILSLLLLFLPNGYPAFLFPSRGTCRNPKISVFRFALFSLSLPNSFCLRTPNHGYHATFIHVPPFAFDLRFKWRRDHLEVGLFKLKSSRDEDPPLAIFFLFPPYCDFFFPCCCIFSSPRRSSLLLPPFSSLVPYKAVENEVRSSTQFPLDETMCRGALFRS